MRNFYLVMAVAGTVVPYVFFIDFMQQHGMSLGGFVTGLFANGAAGGFSSDLLISSFVFWGFLSQDGPRQGVGRLWLYVVLNLAIGLSCALPLYLYVRSGRAASGT